MRVLGQKMGIWDKWNKQLGQKIKSFCWKMKYFCWEMKYLGWKMKLTISICEERTSGIKNICKGYRIENEFFGTKIGSPKDRKWIFERNNEIIGIENEISNQHVWKEQVECKNNFLRFGMESGILGQKMKIKGLNICFTFGTKNETVGTENECVGTEFFFLGQSHKI